MEPPYSSYTRIWHNKPYAAISPTRPELSAAGKTVVVVGASQGVGLSIALAFAEAGAAHIALRSRRAAPLNDLKSRIAKDFPKVQASGHIADVTDAHALAEAATAVGTWDVLVMNTGAMFAAGFSALDANVDEWWRTYEVNIKGTILTLRTFFPTKAREARVVCVTFGAFMFPTQVVPGPSSYNASKLAQAKVLEFLAVEYPDTFFGMIQPGLVKAAMADTSGIEDFPFDFDEPELPANFSVWMASKEADFTRGKFLFANWDVDELKSKASHIKISRESFNWTEWCESDRSSPIGGA